MEKYSILFYRTLSGRAIIEEFIVGQDSKTQLKIRNGIRLLRDYGLDFYKKETKNAKGRAKDIISPG